MSTYTTIINEKLNRVGLVRLNRPEKLNALNSTLITELIKICYSYDWDDEINAIVITGNERVFSAGADISEMKNSSAVDMFLQDNLSQLDSLQRIAKPIIAAVSGFCLGGGNELAMACDMIIASETALFGQPEITIGVIPGAGGTQRLAKVLGKALAMEMVLNGRRLTAEEALHYGLVNRVVPVDQFLEVAIGLAAEIGERAPLAVRLGKELVNHAYESFLDDGLTDERRAFHFLFTTDDQKEGMSAFVEKRKPQWKGR